MAVNNDKSFLGTGWSFPPSFVKDKEEGRVEMVSNEKDIKESLQILLSTTQGERILRSDYGLNLEKLLFEPLDTALESYMQDLIKDAILFHEPI